MATDVGTLQSKLTLDFSQFASGMNSAISMVRSFGKQLQKALGSNATQGFSTTNQAIHNMQTSITNLQAAVSNFQATMQNTNNTLAQFSKVQATTSRMGQNLNQTANGMRDISVIGQKAASQVNAISTNANKVSQSAQKAASQLNGVSNNSKKAAQNARKLSSHLNEAQRFAENLKRILGGIVISQAFYKMLGIMQDLVSSSIQFMNNMEQSAISFKYLLGSAENATGFLQALQDFAVTSPMDMQGAEAAARMLMTMGFQAENTIAVLRVLTDTATVAGGEMSDTVNRIALALGQMLQSGTVKMQELRQLVNANVPIFDILQEELGLTSKQIANIGDAALDSGKAVTAILNGLQKRFGGASLEMQQTVNGALSAIKDSFYILFNEVMAGPYEAFRQKLVQLSNAMQHLAQIARQYGAGGVFEALVPERLHAVIRNVIGAFMQLGQAIVFLGRIAGQVFGGMGEIILQVLNIILPPISIMLNAVLQFTYGLLRAYPAIKYFFSALMLLMIAKPIGAILLWFWRVIGLGKIIGTIVGYFKGLIKAFALLGAVVVAHPIVAAITVIIGVVLALTGVLQKAINKIKEFFALLGAKIKGGTSADKTLNKGMGIGYNPNDILQPTNKETNDSAERYKNSLQDIGNELDNVGDKANKTKNKLKNAFNQSFDEVYGINPDTAGDLGLGGLENLDLSLPLEELGALNDALAGLGDFDLSSWADDFMISWTEMWEKIKQRLKDFGLLALIAGILAGLLTGNPWVGLAAALATLFWPEICRALGLTEVQGQTLLGAALVALLGAVIGKLAGMSWAGMLATAGLSALAYTIGSAIGHKLGEYMKIDMDVYADWFNVRVVGDIVAAIAAGILAATGIISAPLGIAIAAAILTAELCYPIGQKIYEYLSEEQNWTDARINWVACGTAIGGIIGLLLGGPLGAALGLAISTLLTDSIGGALQAWQEDQSGWQIADAVNWTELGMGLGTAIGWLIAGPMGAAIGLALGGLVGFIVDKIAEILGTINGEWEIAGEAFKSWGKDIKEAFLDGLLGDGGLFGWTTELFSWAGECFQKASEAFKNQDWGSLGYWIVEGLSAGLMGAVTALFEPISRIFIAIWEGLCAIFGIHSPAEAMKPIGENVLLGVLEGIIGAVASIPGYIASVGVAIMESIGGWFVDVGGKVSGWLNDGVVAIQTFTTNTATAIGDWVSERNVDFNNFKTQASTHISTWATNTKANITNWATNTKNSISNWSTNTKTSISTWAINTKTSINTWATNIKKDISNWSTNTKQTISNWVTNTSSNISKWWGSVKVQFDNFKNISFTDWCNTTFQSISNWCTNVWETIKDKIGNAINKVKEFLGLSNNNPNVNVNTNLNGPGHATGGVFNREHWARFAEGNKAEAIIPLENNSAMQPFVDAVSNGLTASLAPMLATMNSNGGNGNNLQPLYVGTLIADERSLKELERKMEIIRLKENKR